jgi:trehalose 6-phosphate phosphatase
MQVFKLLKEKLKRIPGAMVENNKFCASVHFRCVEDKNLGLLAEKVKSVLKDYPLLHITDGKKVLEIRPSIEWHKGNALEYLLDSLGLANSKDVMPLYIGDDQTDEDAFQVLKARGQGYSILVSSVAKETLASYSLRDPSEVMAFLHHLVEWKKNTFNSR